MRVSHIYVGKDSVTIVLGAEAKHFVSEDYILKIKESYYTRVCSFKYIEKVKHIKHKILFFRIIK